MKFALAILVAAATLVQPTFGADFTPVQTGRISSAVGKILEQWHYRQAPLDDSVSQTFLKNYFNALDYNHLIFLQSDVDEFTKTYGNSLDDLTLEGDSSPAFKIFERYIQRLDERRVDVDKLLTEKFDFTKDESFLTIRNKAPWPKDAAEAEQLWRLRIKFELLQARLAKVKSDEDRKEEARKGTKEKTKTPPKVETEEETLKTIGRRYQRLERTMKEFDREEILQTYLSSLSHSYDPHSDYMSPTEAANFDIQTINLSLSGIGAQLQWEDGNTVIKALIPGGPAALSKLLKPGDKIVAVAQGEGEPVDVVEMRLNKVVSMIRGKSGTKVRLTIIPANDAEKKVITLTRDEIKLTEQFAKAQIVEQSDPNGALQRYGVINLPQFYDNCASHVDKLITRLKKENINGLVLDLRHNGGGILEEAINLTGLFISKGPVVQVKDVRKKTQVLKDENAKVSWDGPLIVLVGRLSASASEIVAAALQDYGRAIIVGDQSTHGKGTVQTVLSLDQFLRGEGTPNPGKLKITVQKFYRIAGGTTQKQGVTPDIILPSIYDYMELGESSLDNSLPADNTTPLEFAHLDKAKPYLADLSKKSKSRVQSELDFKYLFEDIEEVKKRQADKSISLNEKKRLQEMSEAKGRMEARKKERNARKSSSEHVYDVTLEIIDKNKPLELADKKPKDSNEELAAAAADIDGDADLAGEVDEKFDPQLKEALHILHDYMDDLKPAQKPLAEKAVSKN